MIPIICVTHFQHWLEALEKDPSEIRRELAETARKMMVLRVNEKCLTRRYTTLLELEQHLRKENCKLKDDFSHMEAAVTERIGYLQRFKVLGVRTSLIQMKKKIMNDGIYLRRTDKGFSVADTDSDIQNNVKNAKIEINNLIKFIIKIN